MTFKERFEHYLTHEKRFSQHTVLAYRKDMEQFYALMGVETDHDVQSLEHKTLRQYVVALVESGLEYTSVNRKLSAVKAFFRFLRQRGEVAVDPARNIKGLKQKKKLPHFVPENQLWKRELFEEEREDYSRLQAELIMELLYQTGIRLSELIHLKQHDISARQIKVVGKRNKERLIPISASLHDLIQEYRTKKSSLGMHADENWLLLSKSGKKLTPKFVYNKVNNYLSRVTTNLGKRSPHVLRHTFATHLLNNGASLESIKELLGHVDLSSTQVYTHNSLKQLQSIYQQSHPRGDRH